MGYAKNYSEFLDEMKERMRILGIHDYNIFGDKIDYSIINKLTNNICDFEYENYCMVYAAIYNESEEIGNNLTLLYVPYENHDDWQAEKEDLKAMKSIAYVMNLTYPERSGYVMVVLRSHDGVLERIW